MEAVYWAALAIGGSTLLGAGCGFWVSRVSDAWNDAVTAFAAGVMLSAAAFGLYAPAMELSGGAGILLIAAGTACGAGLMRIIAACSGCFGGLLRRNPGLLFVLAIAVHKFPEGMAGGVGLGGIPGHAARTMVIGIALQNLPEGAVMIPPLLAGGVRRKCAALVALLTGALNVAGVFAGALWGSLSGSLLPFALAFAGGAMLHVILTQMIPRVCGGESRLRGGEWIVLGGFALMACVNAMC